MTSANVTARHERGERRKLTFVGIVLIVCFGIITPLAAYGIDEELSRTAETTATVSGGESRSNEGTQVCRYADVRFTVGDRDYGGVQSVGGVCPDDGGATEVEIRYDPDNPYSFEDGGVDWGIFLLLAAAVVGLLSGCYMTLKQLWLRFADPVVDEPDGTFSMYRRRRGRISHEAPAFRPELLPPGVTAYAIPRIETDRPGPPGLALLAAAGITLVAFVPAVRVDDPLGVLVAVLCGAVPTFLCYRLGLVGRLSVLSLVGVAGAFSFGVIYGIGTLVSFFLAMAAGFAAMIPFTARHGLRRRRRTAIGAPAHDLEPRGGRDVGTLATWRDPSFEYEALDPDPEVVLDACRRLDNDTHAYVSIYRGPGRLDVCGHAELIRAVQQSDHRLSPQWHVAAEPTPAQAERAVRTWLSHGTRDISMTWIARRGEQDLAHLRATD